MRLASLGRTTTVLYILIKQLGLWWLHEHCSISHLLVEKFTAELCIKTKWQPQSSCSRLETWLLLILYLEPQTRASRKMCVEQVHLIKESMKCAAGMNSIWHEVIWSPKPVCSPTGHKTQTHKQSSFPKQSHGDGREHQRMDCMFLDIYPSCFGTFHYLRSFIATPLMT